MSSIRSVRLSPSDDEPTELHKSQRTGQKNIGS